MPNVDVKGKFVQKNLLSRNTHTHTHTHTHGTDCSAWTTNVEGSKFFT